MKAPAIARFNKIDRFAEKYMPFSPYAFTANNPIMFKEIAGDSLVVTGTKRAQRKLRRQIKKGLGNQYKVN